ncbi:MAG: hypothetical protein J3K34DRAFT_526188 [Monoraphidium minutum]|nr:MAG: hypothetical protein J3K34DRAFT_526188 [Monoraphidium minutum]
MPGVCCGCVAQPASVQPRKTYNTLVAQLFAGEPIRPTDPLDSSLRRKIQKLQEYVQKNPAKIPKVSRRLMRQVRDALRKPGDGALGRVKVAAYALIYMLAMSADEASSYTPGFFAKELLTGPDAVVPLLLRDAHLDMRTLGAELLAAFTAVQGEADAQLGAIQEMTPLACRAARAALHAESADQKVSEAAARRKRGDVLAVPNPLDLMARAPPAQVAALEASCLRCLCEVVALAARNKVAPDHLEEMQAVALDNLRRPAGDGSAPGSDAGDASIPPAGPATGTAASTCGVSAAPTAAAPGAPPPSCGAGPPAAGGCVGTIVDREFASAMGVGHRLPGGGRPRDLAERLLQLLVGFVRDIATVYGVMGAFLRYMDARQRWGEAGIAFMTALGASGTMHNFPIYSSLLRHASSPALRAPDAAAVADVAAQQARRLGAAYAVPALAAALQELPRVWAAHARATAGGGANEPGGSGGAALVRDALGLGIGGGGEGALGAAQLRAAALELVAQLGGGGAPDAAAAAMAAQCCDAAAGAWEEGQRAGGGGGECALPGGVLPAPLVSAALAAEGGGAGGGAAAALAAAACRALFAEEPAAWEGASAADADGAGALLAACLAGGAPRPVARLALGRGLLAAGRRWAERGSYAAAGGGDPRRACAALRAAGAAAALAAGPGAAAAPPGLAPPGAAGAEALAALAAQQPAAKWAAAVQAALVASPEMTAEFGAEQLPALLDQPPPAAARLSGAEDGAKQPFADRVNALFTRRAATFRRDFTHVSDLMRDSLAPRPSDAGAAAGGPGAAAIAGGAGAYAGGPSAAAAAAAAAVVEALPLESLESLPSITAAGGGGGAAPEPPFEPGGLLPPASAWLGGGAGAASPAGKGGKAAAAGGGGAAADVARVLEGALNSNGGAAGGGGGRGLSVDDVQISELAVEVEPGWR